MSQLTIASFNIRCYGFGGEYEGRAGDEHRDQALADFISKYLGETDVIVFQEICQVHRLKNILPDDFEYVTYEHDYKRHQHVVIAYKSKYQVMDPTSNGYIVDGVILNGKTSRPALYGQLVKRESQTAVAHLIGVHLKSGRFHTESRLDQMEVICKFVEKLDKNLPCFITGDFNTQGKLFTGREKSDLELFDEVAEAHGLIRLENQKFTYKTQWEAHLLDHIFYTGQRCRAMDELWVLDVNEVFSGSLDQKALKMYYEWISDHLPILGRFEISSAAED
ncbi:MAG: endonuclease/exonuclease/phosphatase family protein [Bdellovibrionales bacterium]